MARPKNVEPEEWKRYLGLRAKMLLNKIEKLPPETPRQRIILNWLERKVPVKDRKF